MLRILTSGYSAKLRHYGRVRQINVATISEQLTSECTAAEYCHILDQMANDFTKMIAAVDWGRMLQQLGMQSVDALATKPIDAHKMLVCSLNASPNSILCNCCRFSLAISPQEEIPMLSKLMPSL